MLAIVGFCLGVLPLEPSHARAELVANVTAVRPGTPFTAAVVVRTDPGWHVYWTNPGDSGIPTTIDWRLPKGWKAEALPYPAPHTIAAADSVTYGYEGEALFLARIVPPAKLTPGAVPIRAVAKWLACREACVAGSADLKLSVGVSLADIKPNERWNERLADVEMSLPARLPGWTFSAQKTSDGYTLRAKAPAGSTLPEGMPDFVGAEPGVVANAVPKSVTAEGAGFVIQLKRSEFAEKPAKRLRGLLLAPGTSKWSGNVAAILVDVPVS